MLVASAEVARLQGSRVQQENNKSRLLTAGGAPLGSTGRQRCTGRLKQAAISYQLRCWHER
jgi:hypothetical protein